MSVWVDPMFNTKGLSPKWPYDQACHMFADTLEELNAMAARIGVRRAWLQKSRNDIDHYDLTQTKRAKAIRHGALEFSATDAFRKARGEDVPGEQIPLCEERR